MAKSIAVAAEAAPPTSHVANLRLRRASRAVRRGRIRPRAGPSAKAAPKRDSQFGRARTPKALPHLTRTVTIPKNLDS